MYRSPHGRGFDGWLRCLQLVFDQVARGASDLRLDWEMDSNCRRRKSRHSQTRFGDEYRRGVDLRLCGGNGRSRERVQLSRPKKMPEQARSTGVRAPYTDGRNDSDLMLDA